MENILLCSDMDRTLLPNGEPPESPGARRLFRQATQLPDLTLAYVTGRSKALIKEAIDTFDLPIPDFAVGDVGTAIYLPNQGWEPINEWTDTIRMSWQGRQAPELAGLLSELTGLHLQEGAHQTAFKLSYYAALETDPVSLKWEITSRLAVHDINAAVLWSIDDQKKTGLLDIVPAKATKDHAIRFLQDRYGFRDDRTVFAGDSGNDLEALTGGLQAVLVKKTPTHKFSRRRSKP